MFRWRDCDIKLLRKVGLPEMDPYIFYGLKSLSLEFTPTSHISRISDISDTRNDFFTTLVKLSLPTLEHFELKYNCWSDSTDPDSLDFIHATGPIGSTIFPRLEYFKLASTRISCTVLAGFLEVQKGLKHVVMDTVYLFNEDGTWLDVASRMPKSVVYWNISDVRHIVNENGKMGYMSPWRLTTQLPSNWRIATAARKEMPSNMWKLRSFGYTDSVYTLLEKDI